MGGKSGGGGSGTNTVVQQSQPPQIYLDAYQHLLEQAQAQQQQPLQQYPGQLVAPFNAAQNEAFGITGQAATDLSNFGNPAAPYINSAADAYSAATQPLWSGVQQFSPSNVQQYESPYTQDVVNATQNQFNQSNQIQSDQLAGNAITKGAFGGDREAVAQGVLAGQQQLNQAPVIAGLYNQNYNQALNEFNTQQTSQLGANQANAWLNSQAASGIAGLGQQAFNTQLGGINANLAGANADLGIGAIQQAQSQQELNVPYEQFIQQQAYPWQTIGWLGGITQGLGTSAGGSASTNYPSPSASSQVAGALLGGAGLVGATGGFGSNGYLSDLFGGGGGGYSGVSAADNATNYQAINTFGARRGGRITHHAGGGIVIPFPQRHARGGGIAADNDDYDDTPLPKRARGGGFGIPDVSLSFVPNSPGIAGGNGGGINGPRMLQGSGQNSHTTGGPGAGGADPLGAVAQIGANVGINRGLSSLFKGGPKGSAPAGADTSGTTIPGASGTYADPANAPGGITWNAADPAASPADLTTAAPAAGDVAAEGAGVDTALIGADAGVDAAEIAALGGAAAEVGTAAEIGEVAMEVAPLILLAQRGGRIPRKAGGGGLSVPHLSPQNHAARPSFNAGYVAPTIGWTPSMTQPSPLVIPPHPAPPPPPDPAPAGPSVNVSNDGGGYADGGPIDDGRDPPMMPGPFDPPRIDPRRMRKGVKDGLPSKPVLRPAVDYGPSAGAVFRAAGGIVGYDDGGDVDETQMSILARSPDPATYFNDPQFSPKLVQDAVNARRAAAEPLPAAAGPRGPVYTGRRPAPGPAREPATGTEGGDEPFLGYRSPLRGGAVPQRRDPTYSMPTEREREPIGSPDDDYAQAQPYDPSEDYDWPPPDLPARPAPGGIVADGGGEPPPGPMTARPTAPQDGGIAPPSRYVNNYKPREGSGRAAEAKALAPWMALIEGGAGMLSSRSPNFGVGLGEGLKAGAKSYTEGRKGADQMAEREDEQRDTGNYHKASLDMQAQRFSDAAEHAKAQLQAQTEHYAKQAEHEAARDAESTRHNKVVEGKGYAEPVRNLTNADGSPVVDKDGVPQALWMDRTNNRTYQGPAPDPSVMGAGRGRQGGATSDLVQHLINEGTVKTWQEGMALVRDPSGKNASTLRTATERLALQAAKSDPEYQSDAKATIDRWRAYYGAGTGPAAAGGASGLAHPTTKADFDALPSGALFINPADGSTRRKQ